MRPNDFVPPLLLPIVDRGNKKNKNQLSRSCDIYHYLLLTAHRPLFSYISDSLPLLPTSPEEKRDFSLGGKSAKGTLRLEHTRALITLSSESFVCSEWTGCQCKRRPPLRNKVYHPTGRENPSSLWPHNCRHGKMCRRTSRRARVHTDTCICIARLRFKKSSLRRASLEHAWAHLVLMTVAMQELAHIQRLIHK